MRPPASRDFREHALFSLATILPLAATGEGDSGFHAPSIADFFPAPFLFEGTPFEFNRLQLVRMVALVALLAVFLIAARRATLVPGRFQNAIEMILDFVRVNVAEEILGKAHARKYVALLTTIFCAILFFNLTSVIPFLNIAGTSLIGLPLLLALWVFAMYLGAGIKAHGLGGFLKNSLFPPGVPTFMYVLLTPIEFLTVFVLRPATLAIRLMANMVAGHLMLVLCLSATQFFIIEAAPAMKAFGALTFVSALALTLFEVFVAALQAYIFVVLTAVYLSLSIEEEH
ncbi:F0F1 ATP synthase subunit A [Pengzhenrongella sicca]|uniref:ATP synthase subunit a n=1 Tax=Pengzhenrongella sicca TaxID=2819238 RepID=A0A8A4ZDX8_9MICO|nr:F0F1 ATP synthase subunit A [Pengzhenrongella sicca]QTE28756.1 F0F1 ATP synthase subunit A [Pengzhenrongella sicca]